MKFEDTTRILRDHRAKLSAGIADLEQALQLKLAEAAELDTALDQLGKMDIALIDRIVAKAAPATIFVQPTPEQEEYLKAELSKPSRSFVIAEHRETPVLQKAEPPVAPAPQESEVAVVEQEPQSEPEAAPSELETAAVPDAVQQKLDEEHAAITAQVTFFRQCADICGDLPKLDAKVVANRLAMKIGNASFIALDEKHRPAFLEQFPQAIADFKATPIPLPDVHPELPGMTQQDQDVLLAMRDAAGESKLCKLDDREVAIRAKVKMGVVVTDVLPRLIALGKIVRTNPDIYPPIHRVADADATFPTADAAPGAKPLPQPATAMLSSAARAIKDKVYRHILQAQNGRAESTVSFSTAKIATFLKITTAQLNDSIEALVADKAIAHEKAHAAGWVKLKVLDPAAA